VSPDRHDAVLEFAFQDERRARIVERSVRREVGEIGGDRTAATLDRDGATVAVTVTASDLVALRAGCNTWTTLVSVAERASEAGDGRRR
jgi:KEOPS complex subunit Pcc1